MGRWSLLGALVFGGVFALFASFRIEVVDSTAARGLIAFFLFGFYCALVIFGTSDKKRSLSLPAQTLLGVTLSCAIAALFGGLLTKMGIYAMIRVFTLIFTPDEFILNVFIGIAIMTMITGALGTINKRSVRRMISYLIVCHIGYLIAGMGMYTELAFVGLIFYLIHDMIIKSNLFMITGVIQKIRQTIDMQRLGGLYQDYPKLSFLMAMKLEKRE